MGEMQEGMKEEGGNSFQAHTILFFLTGKVKVYQSGVMT